MRPQWFHLRTRRDSDTCGECCKCCYSTNRDLTSEPKGIFKVHETGYDDNTKNVAKHISVCIAESLTSSKIGEKIQSCSDSKITYEDQHHECFYQNQLTNEVNGLKTTISNPQAAINSFETTLKDHDSIL